MIARTSSSVVVSLPEDGVATQGIGDPYGPARKRRQQARANSAGRQQELRKELDMSATRQGMTVAATVKNAPKVKDVKDASLARQAFAQFPSGVSVLAVDIGGERHAMVASSFMVGVSLEPCLAAVAIQKGSETWSSIRRAETIGVSIFASGQGQLTRQLAGRDRAKRFDQVAVEVDESGALYIEDAAMWLETSIYQDTDAGDHWMVLLQVSRIGVDVDTDPLIWHGARFRELVRDASIDVR